MAGNATEAGGSLKMKKPQCSNTGASENNVVTVKETNVMSKNITAAPVVTSTVENLVVMVGGQPTTNSLDVAERFGKRHDNVIKAIRNLDCSPQFALLNFEECSRPGANNKPEPYFRMTRDGFTFLCMGFTGKEAAKWKEAYINAFNKMEAALLQATPAKAKRKPKALPGALTLEQQEAIKGAIKARIESLPHEKQGGAAIRCWSSLKSKFGCSYKEIPAEQFSEAVSLVARIELEGEFLPKEEAKPGTVLDDHQLYDVWFVMHHFSALYEIFHRSSLYAHLTGLGSRIGVEMIDHFTDGFCAVRKLSRLGAEFEAAQRRIGLVHGRIG